MPEVASRNRRQPPPEYQLIAEHVDGVGVAVWRHWAATTHRSSNRSLARLEAMLCITL
jgi:hypothetical protein